MTHPSVAAAELFELVTVAASVTDCPYVEGFSEETTEVVLGAAVTLNVLLAAPVNPALFAVRV